MGTKQKVKMIDTYLNDRRIPLANKLFHMPATLGDGRKNKCFRRVVSLRRIGTPLRGRPIRHPAIETEISEQAVRYSWGTYRRLDGGFWNPHFGPHPLHQKESIL